MLWKYLLTLVRSFPPLTIREQQHPKPRSQTHFSLHLFLFFVSRLLCPHPCLSPSLPPVLHIFLSPSHSLFSLPLSPSYPLSALPISFILFSVLSLFFCLVPTNPQCIRSSPHLWDLSGYITLFLPTRYNLCAPAGPLHILVSHSQLPSPSYYRLRHLNYQPNLINHHPFLALLSLTNPCSCLPTLSRLHF